MLQRLNTPSNIRGIKIDFHKYEFRLERAVDNLKKCSISERNKELILDIHGDLIIDGLSKPRQIKYIEILRSLAQKMNKDMGQSKHTK